MYSWLIIRSLVQLDFVIFGCLRVRFGQIWRSEAETAVCEPAARKNDEAISWSGRAKLRYGTSSIGDLHNEPQNIKRTPQNTLQGMQITMPFDILGIHFGDQFIATAIFPGEK